MTEQAPPAQAESVDKTSVFIPKEALGGGEYAIGDKLEMTIKDIDPDTGEVEAMAGEIETESETESPGMNEAIDALPEE